MKIFLAMKPLRIAAWPYAGPIGVRERHDVHVFDNWRYLGSGRNESEVAATLSNRPSPFNRGLFTLLTRRLARLRPSQVICLQRAESCREPDASESPPADGEYSSIETPW
jgi:DNA polymerase-3 subunit epsilon